MERNNKMMQILQKVAETAEARKPYDVMKDGAVEAIRIYFAEDGYTPMADLVLAYNRNVVTICWVSVTQREEYATGINGYTNIYDERPKRAFSEWIANDVAV